jgi:3-oxoacyl-[acyl-carrier protein] reductase
MLADAGARVAITARSERELRSVAAAVRRTGGDVLALPADITRYDEVQDLVVDVVDHFGGIDVLVNAAGRLGPIGVPVWESDPDEWAATLDADVLGVLHTCHAVLPDMLAEGSGRILNMSSPVATSAVPDLGAYCVSKAAVAQLTSVLAAELEGTGVTAHNFVLGPTDSPVYREVCQVLYPGFTAGRGPAVQDLSEACRLLVLLSQQVPLPNGSTIYWREPWVRRGLHLLRAGRWPTAMPR